MDHLTSYCKELCRVVQDTVVTNGYGKTLSLDAGGEAVVNMVLTVREYGRKVMAIGNGGSATIAAHLHNDLAKAVGVRSLCFGDVSLLTAQANDHGYETAYEQSVGQWADDGDLLLAISSSGNSENILRAVDVAVRSGCQVITLSGFQAGNRLRGLGDVNFYVPQAHYGLVESAHAILGHFFTDSAAAALAGKNRQQSSPLHMLQTGRLVAGCLH